MEIKSMQAYQEATHIIPKRELEPSLQARKDVLDKELTVLRKQLGYLLDDLDRMVIMEENPGVIDNKKQQISQINTKIQGREKAIRVLYVHPYAQAVWDEGEAILHFLKEQIQEQYSKSYTLKEQYLESLREIGALRKQSKDIADQASRVRMDMIPAHNPMGSINLSNLDSFTIPLKDVEGAFRG
jgi:hypothetical protein